MNVRLHLAAAVASFALLATVPANATELRESRSHVIVDVPDGWSTVVEGDYATAHPRDQTFHLRIKGTGLSALAGSSSAYSLDWGVGGPQAL